MRFLGLMWVNHGRVVANGGQTTTPNQRNFRFHQDCDSVNVGASSCLGIVAKQGGSMAACWTQLQGCLWPKSVLNVTKKILFVCI